ncbi:MAG: HDIG domain-containing protein [Phycisphaerae bacterium]|nr:HDIG domain-containing protein [Phycisphaerae bacterium]
MAIPFFSRKNKKIELRRIQPVKTSGTVAKLRQKVSLWSVLIGILFTLATSAVIIFGGQVLPWQVGQKPNQDIRVRAGFQELDQQATMQAREQAKQSTPNYYEPNNLFLKQIEQDLNLFYTEMKAAPTKYEELTPEKKESLKQKWNISEQNFAPLRTLVDETSPEQYQNLLSELKARLLAGNIIEIRPEEYGKTNTVILDAPQAKVHRSTDQWFFDQDVDKVNAFLTQTTKILPKAMEPLVYRYLTTNFQPIWQFDKAQTDKQRNFRYSSPDNEQYRKYEAGSILIRQDQRIGNREYQLLKLEHEAYWNSLNSRDRLLANAGTVILVLLVTLSMWVYCFTFQRQVIRNWTRAAALGLSVFLMIALARVLDLSGLNIYTATFEVVLIAAIMTITYDHRFALVIMTSTVLLLMITLNTVSDSISLLLTLMVAGTTVVLTLEDVRSRSKLIEVASAAALMSFAVVWASQLATYQDVRFILGNALNAAGGALVAGFVVQGLLPAIERIFKIATSMTLLECCDVSKPLLRRLAIEAPGTYNHSLQIGALAEAAADAIGANGLLARVGAYYHDIGKIAKPKYFVENQPGNIVTRHKNLSPAMSFLIIIGHVKDGLEIAQEYGLPKILYPFITEHHGTTLVEYFYHLASQQPDSDKESLNVAFRYPGPKPHSKESAILMLADGVEGATRSLAEPTAGRIESIVHQIVKKRLEDGQFDECEITLRELRLVEESLVKSLWAMYHSRIAYPSTAATQTAQTSTPETTTTKVATGI